MEKKKEQKPVIGQTGNKNEKTCPTKRKGCAYLGKKKGSCSINGALCNCS